MEAKVYNKKGEEVGRVEAPKKIFGLSWNGDLVAQVVNSMRSSQRFGTADTKDRGDVRGGGKKPWKQKGTGRARHGSIRSPLWKGGGVTHGPKAETNYDRKVNRKAKNKALFTILSAKFKDGEIVFVDNIMTGDKKTKIAGECLKSLSKVSGLEKISYKKGNRALICLSQKDEDTLKSFGNINTVSVEEIRNIDPVTVLNYKYIVISNPEDSIKILEQRA